MHAHSLICCEWQTRMLKLIQQPTAPRMFQSALTSKHYQVLLLL